MIEFSRDVAQLFFTIVTTVKMQKNATLNLKKHVNSSSQYINIPLKLSI